MRSCSKQGKAEKRISSTEDWSTLVFGHQGKKKETINKGEKGDQ